MKPALKISLIQLLGLVEVWDGYGFSECFSNIVLGFGANIVTLLIIAVLGISRRNTRGRQRMRVWEKVFLQFLPALGACIPFFEMVLLLKKALHGDTVVYHEWFFRCSQFLVWTAILLFSKCDYWYLIFCHRLSCFWWIVKPLLGILHLQSTFSSLEVLRCSKAVCIVLLDLIFGISINVIRLKRTSYKCSSIEDSLLTCDMDLEEGHPRDSGKSQSNWHLMTFKSINPVMSCGVRKQLDFEDLLQLPTDMDPPSCHYILLSSWKAQQSSNCSHPSLFGAICHAYGWPYFRLGLLKMSLQ